MTRKTLTYKRQPDVIFHFIPNGKDDVIRKQNYACYNLLRIKKNHSCNYQAWWSHLHIFQGTTARIELSLAPANL
jgi:hypothetical protein